MTSTIKPRLKEDEQMDFDNIQFKRKLSESDLIDANSPSQKNPRKPKTLTATSPKIATQVPTSQSNKDFYKANNQGPYGVWIRKINKDENELSAYKVGSILFSKYKSILEIRRKDKYRAEVMFKNFAEANNLLSDKDLNKHNLETYLPGFRKRRKGIVKNIPTDLSIDEIQEASISDIEILEISRLKMRNRNSTSDEDKWIPSRSLLITFSGQTLPPEIKILNVKTKIDPYVSRPMQCYSCFKFGHTSKTCKGRKLCIMCGKDAHTESCNTTTPSCANCKK